MQKIRAMLGVSQLDLTLQWPYLMSRLLTAEVKITPDTMVEAIKADMIEIINIHSRERRTIAADQLVIISGRTPDDALHQALKSRSLEVHRIGDCLSPLNIGKAFREGYEVGLVL